MKLLALLLLTLALHAAEPLKIGLPTDNRALLEGSPEDFYQWVPRIIDKKATRPWTAGQYGFVRTLVETEKEGTIATKFHEGLDIKPVKIDKNFNPLDEVRAIASGEVVYVNKSRGGSSYGIYVVVKHDWGYGPFFSLYAHLATTVVEKGQRILGGTPLGIMGFTGVGITRDRAHLHLELCLLASENFEDWLGTKTVHGIYDGRNLIGIDLASLFVAVKEGAEITIPEFQKGATPYFKVSIPRTDELEIVRRYPWLKRGNHEAPSVAWELSFTDSGIPLSVAPSHREVSKPVVTFVRTTRSKHEYYTRDRLTGTGRQASLTRNGLKFIALFTNEYTKSEPADTPEDDS